MLDEGGFVYRAEPEPRLLRGHLDEPLPGRPPGLLRQVSGDGRPGLSRQISGKLNLKKSKNGENMVSRVDRRTRRWTGRVESDVSHLHYQRADHRRQK